MPRKVFRLLVSTFLMLLVATGAMSPANAAPELSKPQVKIVSVNQTYYEEFDRWGVDTTLKWTTVPGAEFYNLCIQIGKVPSPRGSCNTYPLTGTTTTYPVSVPPSERITYWILACAVREGMTICSEASNKVTVIAGKKSR